MADVFICFAPEDRSWVKSLADVLTGAGLDVLWDLDPVFGKAIQRDIETEISVAKAVVAIWSSASRTSNLVKDIAQEAIDRGTLVPVLKDVDRPPIGFRQLRSADLRPWSGGRTGVEELIAQLQSRLAGQQAQPISAEQELDFERSTIILRDRSTEKSGPAVSVGLGPAASAVSQASYHSEPSAPIPAKVRASGVADMRAGDEIGQYRIVRRLGAGGFGAVYEASNIHNEDERVALKLLLADVAASERFAQLLKLEANALLRLKHPAVVQYRVFGRIADTEQFYLVTEFVPGPTLRDWRRSHTPTLDEIKQLAARLSQGLAAAHRRGIVHRDLAPDNVIVTLGDLSEATLIDFGIARTGETDALGGAFAGKFSYAAPEQFEFDTGRLGPSIDIYAFGLLIAGFARGRPIDMGRDIEAAKAKRVGVPPLDGVPPALHGVLTALLQPDPAARPQTMDEVARLFEAVTELPEPAAEPSPEATLFVAPQAPIAVEPPSQPEAALEVGPAPSPAGDVPPAALEPPSVPEAVAVEPVPDAADEPEIAAPDAEADALPAPDNDAVVLDVEPLASEALAPEAQDVWPEAMVETSQDDVLDARTPADPSRDDAPPFEAAVPPALDAEVGSVAADPSEKDRSPADAWDAGSPAVDGSLAMPADDAGLAPSEPALPAESQAEVKPEGSAETAWPAPEPVAVEPVVVRDAIRPEAPAEPVGTAPPAPRPDKAGPAVRRATDDAAHDAKRSPLVSVLVLTVVAALGAGLVFMFWPRDEQPVIAQGDPVTPEERPPVDEPPTTPPTPPITEPPVTDPLVEPPVSPPTEPPVTEPPVSEPPVADPQVPPVTEPPVTEPSTPPVTEPQVIEPPTTPPVTEPPPTPPVTEPPVTEPPVTPPGTPPITEPTPPVTEPPTTPPGTPPAEPPVPDDKPIPPEVPLTTPPDVPPETPPTPPAEAPLASGKIEPAGRAKVQRQTGKAYGAPAKEARIVYVARRETQLRVVAGGKSLLDRALAKGDSYRLPDRRDLQVSVGDAGALDVILDGKFIGRAGPDGHRLVDFAVTPVAYGGPDQLPPPEEPAQPPPADEPPPAEDTPPAEQASGQGAVAWVNSVRKARGLKEVAGNAALDSVAASLATANAKARKNHAYPSSSVIPLMAQAGYGNAYAYPVYNRNKKGMAAALDYWAKNQSAALLDSKAVALGIAGVKGGDGNTYWVMIMAGAPY